MRHSLWSDCKMSVSIYQNKAFNKLYWKLLLFYCTFTACGSYAHPWKCQRHSVCNAPCNSKLSTTSCVEIIQWGQTGVWLSSDYCITESMLFHAKCSIFWNCYIKLIQVQWTFQILQLMHIIKEQLHVNIQVTKSKVNYGSVPAVPSS